MGAALHWTETITYEADVATTDDELASWAVAPYRQAPRRWTSQRPDDGTYPGAARDQRPPSPSAAPALPAGLTKPRTPARRLPDHQPHTGSGSRSFPTGPALSRSLVTIAFSHSQRRWKGTPMASATTTSAIGTLARSRPGGAVDDVLEHSTGSER